MSSTDGEFDPYEKFRWAESIGADVDALAMLDWTTPLFWLDHPEAALTGVLGDHVAQIVAVRQHLEAEGTMTHEADLWLMWRLDYVLARFAEHDHARVCQRVCGDECRIEAVAVAVLRLGRPE